MTPFRIVVAGWGNPMRGDDGAGRWVSESIAERWSWKVTTLIDQQAVPEWAAILSQADLAFFVDASADASVTNLRITALEPDWRNPPSSAHALGASDVLTLAATLYGRAPEAFLLEIPAREFQLREGLSSETARMADHAILWLNHQIEAAIEGFDLPLSPPASSPAVQDRKETEDFPLSPRERVRVRGVLGSDTLEKAPETLNA